MKHTTYIFHKDGNGKLPTRFSKKYVKVIRHFRHLLTSRSSMSYSSMSEMYRDIECLAFPHLSKMKSKTPVYGPQQFSRVVEVALNLGWITIGKKDGKRIPVEINLSALAENKFQPADYIAHAQGLTNDSAPEVHETYVVSGTKITTDFPVNTISIERINILQPQVSDPAYTYVSTISSTMGFGKYEFVK